MEYRHTGLPWILPSPNMPTIDTVRVYTGNCLFEGTNLSEGRGTAMPFETIGAPFVEAQKLADEMNGKRLPGVRFRPVYFQPTASKHQGELCGGVQLHVTNARAIRPVETGVTLLFAVQELFADFAFLPPLKEGSRPFIDLLGGDNLYRGDSVNVPELLARFREESAAFAEQKRQYHLY